MTRKALLALDREGQAAKLRSLRAKYRNFETRDSLLRREKAKHKEIAIAKLQDEWL